MTVDVLVKIPVITFFYLFCVPGPSSYTDVERFVCSFSPSKAASTENPPVMPTVFGNFFFFLCRQKSISKQWQDLLDQLQRREQSLGIMQEILGLLRDVDAIAEELKELQVLSPLQQHTTCSAASVCSHVPGDWLVPTGDKSISYRKNTQFLPGYLIEHLVHHHR